VWAFAVLAIGLELPCPVYDETAVNPQVISVRVQDQRSLRHRPARSGEEEVANHHTQGKRTCQDRALAGKCGKLGNGYAFAASCGTNRGRGVPVGDDIAFRTVPPGHEKITSSVQK